MMKQRWLGIFYFCSILLLFNTASVCAGVLQQASDSVSVEPKRPEQQQDEKEESNILRYVVSVIIGILGIIIIIFSLQGSPPNFILTAVGAVYIVCGILAWVLVSWYPILAALLIAFIALKLL